METNGNMTEMLSDLLSHPDVLRKAMSALQNAGIGIGGTDNPVQGVPPVTDVSDTVMSQPPQGLSQQSADEDRHRLEPTEKTKRNTELLAALRPFVSEEKRGKIDKLIQFMRLAEIAGTFDIFGRG